MTKMSYIEATQDAQDLAMGKGDNIFILGEDVGREGGVFGVTHGLQEKYGELRVIDTPLAESNIIGTVIGAAMLGKCPIAEVQSTGFILPAVSQIISEAARMRYRSNNDWQHPLTVRAPFSGDVYDGLYHSQSIESIFASTPGLTIVIPPTLYDTKGLLLPLTEPSDPVLFFEHKKAYRFLKEEAPDSYYTIPLSKAGVRHKGGDIIVSTYGLCVNYCTQAADVLEADDINVKVVGLRTVYPLDKITIIERTKQDSKILLVTKDNLEGSVMSEVSATIAEHCLFELDAPIMRLAGPDAPSMPSSPDLENEVMMNPDKMLKKMCELT